VTVKDQGRDPNIFRGARYFDISKTARDRGSVTTGHLQEMACAVSDGHVIDDVT